MRLRPGAVVRGAGVALACFPAGATTRSVILFTAYGGGWFLDKPGLQQFMFVPDAREPWKRDAVPFATAAATWSAFAVAGATALRRTRVPVPVAAVLLGSGVTVLDSLLADRAEARDAADDSPADDADELSGQPPGT